MSWVDPLGLIAENTPGYYVYALYDEGAEKPYNVGITNDTDIPTKQHRASGRLTGKAQVKFLDENVTYGQARGYDSFMLMNLKQKQGLGEKIFRQQIEGIR